MGQKGMNVDTEVYKTVCMKLADTNLCGKHTQHPSPELPVCNQLLQKQRQARSKKKLPVFMIDDKTVDTIVDEEAPNASHWHRYLVRWQGYHPSWEAWRLPGRGAIGSPIESWEPASHLRGTRALELWESAKGSGDRGGRTS